MGRRQHIMSDQARLNTPKDKIFQPFHNSLNGFSIIQFQTN
jgi:hypothetical protein